MASTLAIASAAATGGSQRPSRPGSSHTAAAQATKNMDGCRNSVTLFLLLVEVFVLAQNGMSKPFGAFGQNQRACEPEEAPEPGDHFKTEMGVVRVNEHVEQHQQAEGCENQVSQPLGHRRHGCVGRCCLLFHRGLFR